MSDKAKALATALLQLLRHADPRLQLQGQELLVGLNEEAMECLLRLNGWTLTAAGAGFTTGRYRYAEKTFVLGNSTKRWAVPFDAISSLGRNNVQVLNVLDQESRVLLSQLIENSNTFFFRNAPWKI